MTSKKCQTSSSALGIGDKFKVQSPHLGESSPQNSEVTTNVIKQENVQSQPIFANKLSNNEESEDESKENNIDDINSSQSPVQGPNLQSLLFPPATVLAAGLNPYILSSSLSTMTQLLKKTDHSPASLPGLQSSPGPASLLSGLNRPAMTDALLENLRKLNGSHLLGQEADNLRKILESVNLEMTRRILEDNLLRWGGPLPGQGWAERLSGSRHNSCDSDGNMSDTDTESFYLDTERSEAMDTSGERKSRVRSLISDEQLSVLKSYYSRNQMPRREELMQIAEAIGHPYKVVKVWFQNARARDRREGKNLPHLPGFPPSHAHPPFLNNNFQLGSLPRLPLPFLRPGGIPEHLSKLNSLFPFSNLQNFCRAESKSPESIKSDNIDDEMEEDEEETPLDLSNKGSTPGASPALDKEEQFSRQSINFSKLGASFSNGFSNTSSDEEEQTNKVLKKQLVDNKGTEEIQ